MKVELIGGYNQNEVETRIKKVAAAGKLSRFPGNVFEVLDNCNDYDKNLKLIERIIGMGHKSIIEHDYLVFAICDVTPIVEQTIIGNRLTSFTIKSRREVDFRNSGFYVPEFRNKDLSIHPDNVKLKEKYISHMKFLFNTYGDFVDEKINVEDARFILPYSFYSNIFMGLDARQLERLIISLLYSPLSRITELKELGTILFDIAKKYVPYLVPTIENYSKENCNPFSYVENLVNKNDIKIVDKPVLLSYTPNPDDVILKSSIMYHFQCSESEAEIMLNDAISKDANFKEKYMDIILHKDENRELEQVNFTFQIPISLSILTHLTRHRMHSLLVPEFLPLWDFNNYVIPESINSRSELKNTFLSAQRINISKLNYFKFMDVANEDLIYFYLGCQMLNVITTMNARSLKWILSLRTCNKAQWQIRNIAREIKKQVGVISPLLNKGLGASCMTDLVCNEGKECCGLVYKLKENK